MAQMVEYFGWILIIGSSSLLAFGFLKKSGDDGSSKDKEILNLIRHLLIERCFVPRPTKITKRTHFRQDLNLDLTEEWIVVCDLEDHFGIDEISDEAISELQTVGDVVRHVVAQLRTQPNPALQGN